MSDYFSGGDRVPFDSCPDPFFTEAPYTELPILQERILELSSDVQQRIKGLPVPRDIWIKVIMMICDTHDDAFKQGEAYGVQKVVNDPGSYIEPERDEP